jgi:hypothetical protein
VIAITAHPVGTVGLERDGVVDSTVKGCNAAAAWLFKARS